MDCDVVVIGAGVVGLACAERLTRDDGPAPRVVVLERARTFGTETSSRNSEVIHGGMYYPTGTAKARHCVAGASLLYAWCAGHGVPHRAIGKLIVATGAEEEPHLARILSQGRTNGVADLTLLTGRAVRAMEPAVRAAAGLHSPRTGIVDSHAFMASLLTAARARGADVIFRHAVVAVEVGSAGFGVVVEDDRGERSVLRARAVVNSAGLHADAVAALAGIDVDAAGYRLTYVKGSYFRVRRRGLVHRLVYPVPPPLLAGLGVHVTLELDGGMRLGPDVEVLQDRSLDYAVDPGARPRFYAAAARYLDGLTEEDLSPDQAGIRPMPAAKDRGADFILAEEGPRGLPGWVNLIGIESPGLTASLSLAEEVRTLLP